MLLEYQEEDIKRILEWRVNHDKFLVVVLRNNDRLVQLSKLQAISILAIRS